MARGRHDLFLGHGAQVGIALGEHAAGVGEALAHLLQLAELLDRSFEVAERLTGFLILFAVVNDFGRRKLALQLVEALLHLFQTVDHVSSWPLRGLEFCE